MCSPKPVVTATVYDKRNRVLAVGTNSYVKTHPLMKTLGILCKTPNKEYLHAEIAALLKCKRGVPYKIKVERYDSEGNPRNAKPCPICMLAIKQAHIKIVEYTI